MRLTDTAYAGLTRQLARSLPEGGRGRLAFVLEGGYDLEGLRGSLRSTLDALDPGTAQEEAPQEPAMLSDRHAAELARAETAARAHFRLG
jgi:acetoin utilization deacetylase AcuC-like enzyme